jgi:hypothetical protein
MTNLNNNSGFIGVIRSLLCRFSTQDTIAIIIVVLFGFSVLQNRQITPELYSLLGVVIGYYFAQHRNGGLERNDE